MMMRTKLKKRSTIEIPSENIALNTMKNARGIPTSTARRYSHKMRTFFTLLGIIVSFHETRKWMRQKYTNRCSDSGKQPCWRVKKPNNNSGWLLRRHRFTTFVAYERRFAGNNCCTRFHIFVVAVVSMQRPCRKKKIIYYSLSSHFRFAVVSTRQPC